MNFLNVSLIVILCIVPATWCNCTDLPTPMENFEMEQYQGEWFLQAYTPSAPQLVVDPEFRCNIQSFHPTNDPAVFNISNQFIRANGSEWRGENQATVEDLKIPALWTLGTDTFTFTVMALDTDYKNWSLLFACGIFNEFPVQFAMIHSRNQSMDQNLRDYVDSLVINQGFRPEFQLNINQTDCIFSEPWL